MLFNLLQTGIDSSAAVAAAQTATTTATAQEMHYTFLEMAVKGGWLMIVLLILSIIALYILGKKWWVIHKASQIDKNFIDDNMVAEISKSVWAHRIISINPQLDTRELIDKITREEIRRLMRY